MKFKSIVFWDSCLSPHKSDLFNAIAAQLPDTRISLVATTGIPPQRVLLGWDEPVPIHYKASHSRSREDLIAMISSLDGATLNVLSGLKGLPENDFLLKTIRRKQLPFVIVSEPRVFEGPKGYLRWIDSVIREHWTIKQCLGVFAIGAHGPLWFRRVGYSPGTVFPFAYFVDRFPTANAVKEQISRRIRDVDRITIGFVGRFTREKGVLELCHAMHLLGAKYRLRLAGAGPLSSKIVEILESSNIDFDFLESIPYRQIPDFLTSLDLLVLPSLTTDDGWGVVVSEALLAGVFVIGSSKLGASVLLQGENGQIVHDISPASLASAIVMSSSHRLIEWRACERRANWARENLTGTAGAKYFLRNIESISGISTGQENVGLFRIPDENIASHTLDGFETWWHR